MATELRKGSNSMSQKTTLFWAPTVWEARGPWLDRENWQARAASSPWATLPILRISALGSLSQSSSLHGTKQLGRDRSVSHVLEALSVERKERGHPTPGWGWGVEGKSPLRGGEEKPVPSDVVSLQLPMVSAAVRFGDGRDARAALSTALCLSRFCQWVCCFLP